MSTLGGVMNSALSALQASQLGLSVASNNISNAQTPGYSRQRLNVAPSLNEGVDVLGIEALRDQLTAQRLNQETSNKAAQDARHQTLQDIQGSLLLGGSERNHHGQGMHAQGHRSNHCRLLDGQSHL